QPLAGRRIEYAAQNVRIQVIDTVGERHQWREPAFEDVITLGIQNLGTVSDQISQPGLDPGIVIQEISKEAHDFQNIGLLTGNGITDKHPKRLFDIEIADLLAMRIPQP